jgi:hypothetical protein
MHQRIVDQGVRLLETGCGEKIIKVSDPLNPGASSYPSTTSKSLRLRRRDLSAYLRVLRVSA